MQTRKIICYIFGSIVIFVVAGLVIPKLTRKITNNLYKNSIKNKNENDEDDWGPEIVKKTKE